MRDETEREDDMSDAATRIRRKREDLEESKRRRASLEPYVAEPKGWNQVPATRHIVQPSESFLSLCGRTTGKREAPLTARALALAPKVCGSCKRVAESRGIWPEEV